MRKMCVALLAAAVSISSAVLIGPVQAGDYYGNAYRRERDYSGVRYSTDCCYRKVTRVVRSVRYQRVDDERSRYRPYDRYRGEGRHRQSWYSGEAYPSRRYVSNEYSGRNGYRGDRIDGGDCVSYRVDDGRGGWVWGRSRCY